MSRLVGLTLFALGCGSDSDPEQSAGPSCDLQVDAGDNVAAVLGTTVHLAASSECTGRWAWTLQYVPEGSSLSDSDLGDNDSPTAYATTFTPDVAGTYVLGVSVSDGDRFGPMDVVVVDVDAEDLPPVADCGSPTGREAGQSVALDASASFDPEGAPLQFHWVLAGAPACSSLSKQDIAGGVDAILVPDCDGVYTVALTVDDGSHASDVDYCTVDVATANQPPIADAGPGGAVRVCDGVFVLDGYSSYDKETFDLVYDWRVLSTPPGSIATDAQLDDPTAVAPGFRPDQDGEYSFSLQVFDGQLWSAPDIAVYDLTVGECE
jgi:hypothetical protein